VTLVGCRFFVIATPLFSSYILGYSFSSPQITSANLRLWMISSLLRLKMNKKSVYFTENYH
jgi:hypothetical protein